MENHDEKFHPPRHIPKQGGVSTKELDNVAWHIDTLTPSPSDGNYIHAYLYNSTKLDNATIQD